MDWEARFKRGDRDVMERLYRDTFDGVRRVVGRVLREPADRDNVVHQVFAEVIARKDLRESYRGGEVSAWLASMARHKAIDFARRESRLEELPPEGLEEPPEDGDLRAFREDLRRFAERLAPDMRRLLELRFLMGLTQMETAAEMQVPRSTLEDREHALKKQLRAYLLEGGGS